MHTRRHFITVVLGITLSTALHAEQLQRDVASGGKLQSVSKTDSAWQQAMDAHELSAAAKLIGQAASFKGTVSKVYESRDGDIVILDFDANYRTALTAVLKKPDFRKFPDLRDLSGKEIIVSGSFVDYQGKAEIVLTSPDQIKLVK
jgi:hypothetical protein